jgi:hypothetical protein
MATMTKTREPDVGLGDAKHTDEAVGGMEHSALTRRRTAQGAHHETSHLTTPIIDANTSICGCTGH